METPDRRKRKTGQPVGSSPPQNTYFFLGLTFNMSWQLAVAVFVPIYGGYLLDNRFQSAPLCFIIGGVAAAAGSIYVVKRTLDSLNETMNDYLKKDAAKK